MKIPILYEDKDVVVINKPAGLVVHSDGKNKQKTLVDWILKKYPRVKNVGEPLILNQISNIKNQNDNSKLKIKNSIINRPGIVHRIDRDTSGALIIAKNKESFEFLKQQFKDRKVHKVYHTFVYGDLKEERGMIDRPIGRSSTDFRKWTAQRGIRGEKREAVTYFKVLNKKDLPAATGFKENVAQAGDITFVEAMPKTGRTHQIRVHFNAINHPIVQDKLYATDFYLSKKQQLGFKRMALHARELEIMLPSKKILNIIAPYPEDFEEAMKKIGI